MSDRIRVCVHASDPLSEAGVVAQLGRSRHVEVVDRGDSEPLSVVIVVADEFDEQTAAHVKAVRRTGVNRVVLVATKISAGGLMAAVEAGVCGILRRFETTAETLDRAIRAAVAGEATAAPDLVSRLFDEVGRLQHGVLAARGLGPAGLSDREAHVLRLLAEGCETAEIARELCFSERTIKNVVHDVTSRLRVRNRSQAVAYAVREGLI